MLYCIFQQNELRYLRVRAKRHEIMVAYGETDYYWCLNFFHRCNIFYSFLLFLFRYTLHRYCNTAMVTFRYDL
jgi:hypothetical protein